MPGSLRLGSLIPGLAHMRGSVELKVGVMSGATNPKSSIPVAEYATYNEYGAHIETDTKSFDIPARSFLRGTLDLNEDRYVSGLAQTLAEGVDPEIALELLGQVIEDDVKQAIETWEDPPNSPRTIRKKGRDMPLRDTGSLYRAITHTVEPEA